MGDDDKQYTITLGEATDEYPSGTVSFPNPSYTVSVGTDYPNDDYVSDGTFTINANNDWSWNGGTYIDEDLVKSNPTCQTLWDQFMSVYNMVKADKDNETGGSDDIPF